MAFSDYSNTPALNTTIGDSTFIGPNMARNDVRPALQQLAADGRALYDEMIGRGELAAFIASGTGAIERTAQDKLRDTVSPKDFGVIAGLLALPAPNTAAMELAVEAASTLGKALSLGGETYMLDASGQPSGGVNFARAGLRIRGDGAVLRFSGTGRAFVMDQGGADGSYLDGMSVEDITIIGGAGVTDGFYSRGVVRSVFRNIEVQNVTGKAFHIKHAVSCHYDSLRYSTNTHTPAQTPAHGLYIDNNGAGYYTANCVFTNPVMEGFAGIACQVEDGSGNQFNGGTFEAATTGLVLGPTANRNSFDGVWFESNTAADALISGNGNSFTGGCYFGSIPSGANIQINANGDSTMFDGGTYIRIVSIDAAAQGTSFHQCKVDRNLSGTTGFQGAGSFTRLACTKVDGNLDYAGEYPDIIAEVQAIGISGVWTPVLVPGSGTITPNAGLTQGRYRKIGDQVTLQCQITVTSVSTPGAGLTITGAPFAAAVENACAIAATALEATATDPIYARLSGSTITLYKLTAGAATNMAADIKAGSVLTLSVAYQAA